MAESSRRYNLRDTRKKPQGVLLKRWEVEYSKLISNENRRIPLETIKHAIRSAFEDGMIEQWRITLRCLLSGQRIKIPARYADCTHIECFDLEAFLRMKTQKNLLVCPVCQREVQEPLANLRIDKYIETVLSTMPDAMQVELLPDGSFTEVHAEFVSAPNVINDEEQYVQDCNMLSFNVKQEALEDDDDYITLSDGEDVDLEEITIVDMKPISLMPLKMDIKPKITSSSEPEQINSREEQEIQDQHNAATQNADISENDQKCSTDSAAIIQFNVKIDPEVVGTSETEIRGSNLKRASDVDNGYDLPTERKRSRLLHTEQNLPQVWEGNSMAASAVDDQNPQQLGESSGESASNVDENEYARESESDNETLTCKTRAGSKIEEKRFKCDHCSYSAKRSDHLLTHRRIHTGEKPFKCTQCLYAGVYAYYLKKHMRTHTGEKPYKCSQCSYASAQHNGLKTHMLTHTGEKPHKCGQCSYASATTGDLKMHIRNHTGEKPYTCNQCSYASNKPDHLKIHIRTHTGEKPYKCRQCPYACAQSANLKSHMRTHI